MRLVGAAVAGVLGVAPVAAASAAVDAGPAPADARDVLGGEPVDASTDRSSPTEVSTGLWAVELPGGADPKPLQFSYERKWEFSTVHISVTGVDSPNDAVSIDSRPAGASEDSTTEDCGSSSEDSSSTEEWASVPFTTQITVISDDLDSPCMGDEIEFAVGRGSYVSEPVPELPVTVKVVEEQRVTAEEASSLPPPVDSTPTYQAPAEQSPESVDGGASFADAPEISDGTVSGSISQGETRFYKVPLDWGQTLSAKAVFEPITPADPDSFYGGPDAGLAVYTAMRNEAGDDFSTVEPSGTLDDVQTLTLTNAAGPVRYNDRFGSRVVSLPGYQWVAVTLEGVDEDGGEPISADYTLTVEAQGEVQGAPAYKFPDEKAFRIGEDDYSDYASGNPPPAADESSARLWWAAGLGLVGIACLGAGAVSLRRR